MNYQQARIFFISVTIILILAIAGLILRPRSTPANGTPAPAATYAKPAAKPAQTLPAEPEPQPITSLHISQRVGNLAKQFADMNPEQLVYARRIGITPISSTRDIMKLKRPILKIESGDNYQLDNLTHSYPYLVPEAAELLDTIGARFNHKLETRGGGRYKIKVTSLLRTRESVNRLRHGNVNSTENSAHLYGTTFDISYVGFHEGRFNTRKHTDGELKNLLAEVLLELREEGKCLVKFERKQGCFHITATGN